MTLRLGQVPGAAGSGTKFRPRSASDPKPDWRCSNGHACCGFHLRCMTTGCNEKRPR